MNLHRSLRLWTLLVSISLAGVSLGAQDVKGFAIHDTPGQALDIRLGKRTVARYMYAYDRSTPDRQHETYKPYLHIFDAEGERPITKGARGKYTHHRGIFIGWSRIQADGQSYDLWHMKGVDQRHEKFLRQEATEESAVIVSQVAWSDRQGKPLIVEERSMRFRPIAAPGIVVVDFESRLRAERALKLGGDPEHAGVQYRPANEVDTKETTYLFPKAGADPKKDLDYPWVGETYALGGEDYSVVHMNHPQNPRGTRYSAYRDYGRFGAFFTKDLSAGETLVLRYRFLVKAGSLPPVAEIQRAWDRFAGRDSASAIPETTLAGGRVKGKRRDKKK